MTPDKKAILKTVILCFVVLFLTFPRHGGFILIFFLLFLIPSIIKSLYIIFVKHQEKKLRAIQISLWVVSCVVVAAHHIYLHKTTRVYANSVSNSIEQFYSQKGVYPSSIEEVGIKKESLRKHKMYYSRDNQGPNLMYAATWIVFDTYYFDFKSKTWKYRSS